MLLINPPIVKPSEPPAGIAKLSGALFSAGIRHAVLDANIEGIYYLLRRPKEPSDTWTHRAFRNLSKNIEALKTRGVYGHIDRYKRAVMDVNRVLERTVDRDNVQISLADYSHPDLAPVNSRDLIYAALHPEQNPFYPYFTERLRDLVENEGTSTAGISLNYLSQALTAFAMIGFVRREYPRLRIVVGGSLITSWMRNPGWQNPFEGLIDRCVDGPGEFALLEILGKRPLKQAHYRPAYALLPVKDYFSPGFVLPYSTSTGCWWGNCSFCPEKAERNTFTQTPSDTVIDDLTYLIKQSPPALIHFTDNAVSPAIMKKIGGTSLNTPWYGFARITSHLSDPGFCKELKASGCVMLKLGLESGDQGVLDYMHKGCDVKEASETLKALKKAGIAAYVYLLFGTPSETMDAARKTLDFVAEHSDLIDFLNLAVFNLPVNSPEADRVETTGFYEGDLALYKDFKHPDAWGRRQVRQFLEKEFRKHPAAQRILRNQPPFFTSNHAPFIVMERRGTG